MMDLRMLQIDDHAQLPWDLRKVTLEITLDQWARLTAAVHHEDTVPTLRVLLMDIWNANSNVSDTPIRYAIAAALKDGQKVPGARLIPFAQPKPRRQKKAQGGEE